VFEKVFVCVGPNTGDTEMIKIAEGHDRFWFFEPLPEAAAWLREANKGSEHYIHIIEAACGEVEGESVLTVYNKRGESSSLGKCSRQAEAVFAGVDWTEHRQIDVKVVNLCKFMEHVKCERIETLMIDAQGMDLAILKTMRPYLEARLVNRIIHEIDADGFNHYVGVPDNSFSSACAFMNEVGGYTLKEMPEVCKMNFDVEWVLKP
jgi:FkbM family methyltransferase